jgi:hypothetical protein
VLTVYFDTSFYIDLLDPGGDSVVEQLNELGVRPVLSWSILNELLRQSRRPLQDRRLVELVQGFRSPPFVTQADLSWELLLLEGQERRAAADRLRYEDGLTTEARSHSRVGRIARTKKQNDELMKAYGLSENPTMDDAVSLTRPALDQLVTLLKTFDLREDLEELQGLMADWFESRSVEASQRLSVFMFSVMDRNWPGARETHQISDAADDSVVLTDPRPFRVATNAATAKELAGLAHQFRDADHIAEFIRHRDEIDLLQLDGAQWKQLENKQASHLLAQLGLRERCFCANSPISVVEILRRRVSEKLQR